MSESTAVDKRAAAPFSLEELARDYEKAIATVPGGPPLILTMCYIDALRDAMDKANTVNDGIAAEYVKTRLALQDAQHALTARDAELREYKQRAELAEIAQVEHNKEFGRCADLKVDALRYRWLRDRTGNSIMHRLMDEARPAIWDRLVDADMEKRSER